MTSTANLMIILGDATIKVTLLLGLAAGIVFLLRPASAAARHLVWSLGLVGALCLPLLAQTLPRLDLALPRVHRPQARSLPPAAPTDAMPVGAEGAPEPAIAPNISPEAQPLSLWPLYVLVIWAAGIGLTLMRLFSSAASVRKIARASVTIEGGPLAASAAAARRRLALHRPVDFRRASVPGGVSVPMGWGCLRPTVILPAEATQWPRGQVEAALLHELAHVKRQDWLVQTLAQVVCVLYWFHPLVWLAARQARQESEYASDNLVLGSGIGPADYAGHLVGVVRSAQAFRATPATVVALVRPSALNRRVSAILASHPSRQGRTPRMAAVAVALAAVIACPLAALRPVGAAGRVSSEMVGTIVVVDAGHGGRDTGGVGRGGVTEKALDLEIARRLRAELVQRGAVVFMTRDADTLPSMGARTQLANAKHANYFISVHCDSGPISKAGSVVFYHGQGPVGRRLAASVAQGMRPPTGEPGGVVSDTTRFQRGYYVLRTAAMPSVLVECGSMTDSGDLARLQGAEGQQRIAEGIAAGLSAFQEGRRKTPGRDKAAGMATPGVLWPVQLLPASRVREQGAPNG